MVAAVESVQPEVHSRLLGLQSLSKTYPNGTVAVRGVTFDIERGSVHGLVGANGAGKSTLIKMIGGAITPSGGRLLWHDRVVSWSGPKDARRSGIAVVHQHTPLVATLSVAENVFLAVEGSWRYRRTVRDAQLLRLQSGIGCDIAGDRLVADLSIGERQLVALLQALASEPKLLVLDEPTASLSLNERALVFQAVRHFVATGDRSVLFVSHLLDEVMELTDHLTVLRDGVVVLSDQTPHVTADGLVQAILGRLTTDLPAATTKSTNKRPGPRLVVEGLSSPGKLRDVSFTVGAGEVVGLAGLLGSGRSEILHAVFGADKRAKGLVQLNGHTVRRSPVAAVKAGMALVPEDRGTQGYVARWEIWRNASLASLSSTSRAGIFVSPSAERERARSLMAALSLHAASEEALVDELSGGNAQKVVLAKWLHESVQLLLLDEPTAGIDIGAKRDVQQLLRQLAEDGRSIVIVDSEMGELLHICDRVLVVNRGQIVAERYAAETNEGELIALASGLEIASSGRV